MKKFTQPYRMYEHVKQILNTIICIARMAFLIDLAVSGIWPINQPTIRHRNFFLSKRKSVKP